MNKKMTSNQTIILHGVQSSYFPLTRSAWRGACLNIKNLTPKKLSTMNIKRKIKSEKADEPRTFLMSRITFAVCFFVSVGLIVGGFFVPPMGVIDGSCLTAVGELLVFPALLYGFRAVELGLTVKFQKGDSSIEIHKDDDDKQS